MLCYFENILVTFLENNEIENLQGVSDIFIDL